jgi:Zn-dependent M28 family amino/carboxypeptidase
VKSAIAFALIAAVTAPVAAQTFSPERIRADVTFLADDLLEGRNAGERGYDIAARYVATEFLSLGLQPAVSGSWYQHVPFQESSLTPNSASLSIGGKLFANGGDILMGPSQFEARQSLTAPVVFAGYGLKSADHGIDDYAGLDVRGKVVAVLSGFPKGMASDVGAHLSSDKARVAQEQGAIGVVSIMTPAALRVYPWERRVAYVNEPGLTWIGPDGKPYATAPAIRASASLNTPAATVLFAGAPRTLQSVLDEAAKEGGRPKGFALRPQIAFKRNSTTRRMSSPNVLAILPGSDPQLRNEYVVMMGHLDHEGVDEGANGDKIYNGAMDNAAGIATMLEAARAMVSAGTRPKRSILFAAVTAEEDGLLGAQYLAKHPVVGNGKVVGVVNLDMPILTYDFQDVVAFGAEHSTLGPMVQRAASGAGVKLSPDPDPEQSNFVRSDHYRFVQEGVPSIFLVTGPAGPGKAAVAEFVGKHYHRVSDQIDLPFNWNAAAKFARINYLIARDIADAQQAPRWYANSFFGNTFAKDAPRAPTP